MSTTAHDIIEMALRRIRIVSRDEAMEADDVAHALKALNLMLHGWDAKGANINHSNYELSSSVQIDERLHDGIVHLLAVRLATDFSVPLPTSDGTDYRNWWQVIRAAGTDQADVSFDSGLLNLPSQRRPYASG